MSEKLNRKKAYSRMVIRKAFLTMLGEMPISKITVKALCACADVNRTTFYANYEDIYELLRSIKDELFETLRLNLGKKPIEDIQTIIYPIFQAIHENMDVCKIIFSLEDDNFIRDLLYIQYSASLADWQRRHPGEDGTAFDYLFEYQTSGSIGMVRKWIAEGAKQPWQQIAEYACAFNREGME